MPVVGIAKERPDSPTTVASLNQRKYVRKWRVQVDSYADGPAIVTHAPGIPLLYTPYLFGNEYDYYAWLRELKAERVQANSLTWIVTGEYTTPEPYRHDRPSGGKQDTTGANDNPLLQLPEIETDFEKFQEVVYYVYDIKLGTITPCRNSAGEVFVPPPTKDASRLVLTISRNEAIDAPHPAADIVYQDSVNADTFWGLSPGMWKCQSIKARRERKTLANVGAVIDYLKVVYKFEARLSWDTQLLDQGTYYWTSAPTFDNKGNQTNPNAKKKAFLTSDFHPCSGPLDGTGLPLYPQPSNGDIGKAPVFLPFRFYVRQPFGLLGLPQSFIPTA